MYSEPSLPTASASPLLYPDFSRRVSGAILDGLVMFCLWFVVAAVTLVSSEWVGAADSRWREPLLWTLTVCCWWLYFAVSESSSRQGTFGAPGPVIDGRGERIDFWRASARFACLLLSIAPLLLGFIMCAWTQRRQALHDLLTDTYLVNGSALWAFKQDSQAP